MNVKISPQLVSVEVDASTMGVNFANPIARDFVERDPYEGEYEITPSAETQTLRTKSKRMTSDVVINPIPSNYGLITWNGAFLTVS